MEVIVDGLWVEHGAHCVLKEGGATCSDYAQILEVYPEGPWSDTRVLQSKGW